MMVGIKNFTQEALGGISAGLVVLPVALAFGMATGLGVLAGMYTAILLGLFATLYGGTKAQISGPTGPMTIVAALIVAQEIRLLGSLELALPTVTAIFVLTGLIQILFGLLKLAINIRYVPYTVVNGFMSGIGILIIILQVKDVFGVYDSGYRGTIEIISHLPYFIANIHWVSFLIACTTLLIVTLFGLIKRGSPGYLIALVGVTGVSMIWDLEVPRLGTIHLNFSDLIMPPGIKLLELTTVFRITLSAFSLAILGSINALRSSKVADMMTGTTHNSNKELIGQGLGNFAAALGGGFPGSGSAVCTVANIQSGGRNKISGVISSLFLFLVLVAGSDIIAVIPHALLAGVLIYIGYLLIDLETFRGMKSLPKADNVIFITVLILTVFWKLLFAVIIGVVLSVLLSQKKNIDVQ